MSLMKAATPNAPANAKPYKPDLKDTTPQKPL